MAMFVVKLRNGTTRMWGDEAEINAGSAAEAAEQLACEPLRAGTGLREDLRARVWATPVGTMPDISFYRVVPGAAEDGAADAAT